jgi:hypothetical protein
MNQSVKLWLDLSPWLYLSILRLQRRGHWSRQWIVSRDTHVVIEGFPRSANSFARAAFLSNQPDIRDATHVHFSSQVVQACRWRVPTLVLLRDVDDAVCADVAFRCDLWKLDPSTIPIRFINDSLTRYIAFYERIAPFCEYFYLGHFPDVTSDFGSVMRGFNQFYGTDFVVFEHTSEAVSAITSKSHHIGPTANRNTLKAAVRSKYDLMADEALKRRGYSIYSSILETKGIVGSRLARK